MAGPSGKDGKASKTRGEAVYRGLRRAIIEAALRPGTKLPEDAVGESFGVSRTVVRSVLARLAGEGLVTQQVNRRAAVAAPTLDDARDLFRVRHGLERTVVEILAGRLTKDQVARLVDHVAAESAIDGRDGPASIRLAGEFHTLLAEMTGNEILARYINEVVSRGSLVLAIYGRPHSSDCAVNEHRELIEVLVEGPAQRAVELMDRHLAAVASRALLEHRAARELDLTELLQPYAASPEPPAKVVPIKAKQAGRRR